MMKSLFELRGKLPTQTALIIEILGLVLIVGIWQMLTSISNTPKADFDSTQIQTYYPLSESGSAPSLDSAYILLYDAPLVTLDLAPLMDQLQKDNAQSNLLILSNNDQARGIERLDKEYPNVQIVAANITAQGDAKTDLQDQLNRFVGSGIVDADLLNDIGEQAQADYKAADDSTKTISDFRNPILSDELYRYLGQADKINVVGNQVILQAAEEKWINPSILPSPLAIVSSFKELFQQDKLIPNTGTSLYLNFMGYIVALLVAIPLGFLIGLFPLFRSLFGRQVDALRFLPLTAVIGLFVAWFGIESSMKIYFLAFGIIVYLLPVVVQRIDEVERVYVQTAYTLGASKWQKIKSVFLPAVLAKVSDDIRVLVAISWTYIIVAELVNASSGGIGALVYKMARQSQIDKVFAILFVIIIIGFVQDRVFALADRFLFPHKYATK